MSIKKQKKMQFLCISVFAVILMAMSVGFAAYSTRLKISSHLTAHGAPAQLEYDLDTANPNYIAKCVTEGVNGQNRTEVDIRDKVVVDGNNLQMNGLVFRAPQTVCGINIPIVNRGAADAQIVSVSKPEFRSLPNVDIEKILVSQLAINSSGEVGVGQMFYISKAVPGVDLVAGYNPLKNSILVPGIHSSHTQTVALYAYIVYQTKEINPGANDEFRGEYPFSISFDIDAEQL